MLIYQLVFGVDAGQVHCCFHNDNNESAGIGPNGEFNCFACGAKAHNEVGFIAKYFNVSIHHAQRIKSAYERIQNYKYTKRKLSDEQLKYCLSQGITEDIANKYLFQSSVGKLIYAHTWNGIDIGYTWFNPKELSTWNASAPKYKYDKNTRTGMVTPYLHAIKYKTLIVTEGEKDMLTALSKNFTNTVAKIGGAQTRIIAGKNFFDKNIILCYDCDQAGREGAKKDAIYLTEKFNCKVKIVDLNLKDGEDLNDYFIKYAHSAKEFKELIKTTPVYIPSPEETKEEEFSQLINSLSPDELDRLLEKIKEKKEN